MGNIVIIIIITNINIRGRIDTTTVVAAIIVIVIIIIHGWHDPIYPDAQQGSNPGHAWIESFGGSDLGPPIGGSGDDSDNDHRPGELGGTDSDGRVYHQRPE